jgi:hypothetical protein
MTETTPSPLSNVITTDDKRITLSPTSNESYEGAWRRR